MASHNQSDQDIRPGNGSIPLQDLSRPPEAVAPDERGRRGRATSVGNLSTHASRRSLIGGGSLRRYERIAEDSPSPIERTGFHVNQPTPAGARLVPSPYVSDMDNASPIEDPGGFAQAMTSVGLSFDGPQPRTPPFHPQRLASGRSDGMEDNLADGLRGRDSMNDVDDYFASTDTNEDTTPLTNRQYLQPIDGAADAGGLHDDRSSTHTVHFPDGAQPGSRLGDDLPNLENGLRGRRADRSRSLSPSASGSALSRASSMMRMMSQRVVNLSNEPELVEQSLKRRDSLKSARLEGPPTLPAMTEYAHDASSTTSLNLEPPMEKPRPSSTAWRQRSNPLRGRSLGILAPDNPLRMRLCDILVHPITEPFILVIIVIQTILLAVESAQPVFVHPRSRHWGASNLDYAFFAIFVLYTLELIARILVSGFIKNPTEYSTLDRSLGVRKALAEKGKSLFTLQRQPSTRKNKEQMEPQPSVIRTFTGMHPQEDLDDPIQRQRVRLAHRAFLRHSFNRLDFVAVVSYWISFGLSLAGYEFSHHMYVFRMMSCLRILRLLGLTNGTSVILRSLKKAAPLLVHVAFLIGFFWLLFAIVGIQSFKSSLRRTCIWTGQDGQDDFPLNDPYGTLQFCGGYLDADGSKKPWITAAGIPSSFTPKGYLCPQGSLCKEGSNPYNDTVSFDNILQSLELVFVIMSSNTFTDLLYYTTDSDYLASALFFAAGIVILSLWLVNLLVAVITSSFQVIREESKRSAFAVDKIDGIGQRETTPLKVSRLKHLYNKTYWLWVSLIAFDLVVQCLRSATMGEDRAAFIDSTEIGVTIVLLFEIILRFLSDWRQFHKSRFNWVDLGLAVITCIILIPPIRHSERVYSALTLFQVLRVYRVVLAFSVTRDLIMIVFRNAVGLINLIIFVFLITFLAAIFAAQLFRGQIPQDDTDGNTIEMSFFSIYNAFLGMYQILSSENWTTMLYNSTNFTSGYHTSWISASFFIMWFILANFIILNMFIAVIQESFDVSEDEKRLQQVKAFLQQKQLGGPSQGNLPLFSIFKLGRNSDRYKDPLDHGPAALEMLLKDAVVHEFLDEQDTPLEPRRADSIPLAVAQEGIARPGFISGIWSKVTSLLTNREPNPFYSKLKVSREYDHLDPRSMAREVVSAAEQRKRAQREYLQKHPKYNMSLYIFAPDHPVRRFCQRIVGPGRGTQRFEGVDPYKPVWYTFSAFIYAAIVAMVLIACITTPIYQRDYSMKQRELVMDQDGNIVDKYSVRNWYVWADMGFAAVFTIEAIIKVIADGFFWTPNAYFRSSWGFIDGIVLITLWINVITSLFQDGTASRAVGAFKALRALRLLNVSDSARDTFHSVIIIGGWKVIAAAFVSIGFLIPFAIYGVTLFNGKMISCNDGNVTNGDLAYCVDEYQGSPFNWNVLAPRVAANDYYSFDNFGEALFILFQIVSQEGWIDVQSSAMSITGKGLQPQSFASQANGLYFIVFNLLGAVFVLTLFVSVFMRNYTEQTGVAFLTAEQRSWLELRKRLRQISPSKRSISATSKKWKVWCYRIAIKKHGRWARCMTTILLLHLTLLMLEFYPSISWWDTTREALFFLFTWFYIANVVIRFIGLGWQRFSKSSWDLYSVVSVSGTFVTTLLVFSSASQTIIELNKLFLVSITLLIIPRNNQLDQLFKTAAASLTAIGNLLATWVVLFLVYAIAMTQTFGLTKFGGSETNNLNFRDVPKALIFLFRTSCGEGWNQLMEDFATMLPPTCTLTDEFFESDCGSKAWARGLFISWNIISMYIFVSLFVSLIFESFSYVYQRSSGLYAISREELRRFKQAWATFDPNATGYISKEQFPRLLGELSGIFDMRIYEGEFTVGRILEKCRTSSNDSSLMKSRSFDGIDLDQLERILNRIPVNTVRARRQKLNVFYEEVLVSADPDFGISFTSCLMILAHYNVISDSKSLRLEEFLRRRARLQRVEETVRRKTVIGFFDTLYWSRQFRRQVEARKLGRMTTVPQFAVPEIFVDHGDGERSESDNNNATLTVNNPSSEPSSPMLSPTSRNRGFSNSSRGVGLPRIDTTLAGRGSGASTPTEWSSISPSLSPRRNMDVDTSYYGASGRDAPSSPRHSRDNSAMSVNDVMESLDNSVWGESIRRSFTQRRSKD